MRKTALNSIYNSAKINKNIIFIGSDLGSGVLNQMKDEMPDRFFMEGIAEQHIMGMAAGLAFSGYIPFVNTIATFLTRRCFEQIAIDVCLHRLPVRLIANGGCGVYAPLGPTHVSIDDFTLMRSLPNMTIVAPCDADEMERAIKASINYMGPMYIRLGKGGEAIVSRHDIQFDIGKAILMKEPGIGLIISTGVMTQVALEAAKKLDQDGMKCGVLHVHTVKPLDEKIIKELIHKVKAVITVEEHMQNGGLGTAILECVNEHLPNESRKIKRLGIPHEFPEKYGSQNTLLEHWGLSAENIYNNMKRKLQSCEEDVFK